MAPRYKNHTHINERQIEHSSYGLTPYALVLLALSVICFIGAAIQNGENGTAETFKFSPEQSDQEETLRVKEANSIYAVTVRQSPSQLPNNKGWSDVAVVVRSNTGEQVLSFGGDFWRASGYSDGHWSETKSSYTMKTTFPVKGDYKVSIESSSSQPSYNQPVTVRFEPRNGSTLPLLLLGVPALIIGVFLGYWSNHRAVNEKLSEWSENME